MVSPTCIPPSASTTCRAHPPPSQAYNSFLFSPSPSLGTALRHLYRRYQEYVNRFHSLFPAPPSVPVYYIPGNHDVGLGDRRNASSLARARYRAAFGPLSQHVSLGGHSLFMVDAPALVDEDLRRENAGEVGSADGLPEDLKYLQHSRLGHAASG